MSKPDDLNDRQPTNEENINEYIGTDKISRYERLNQNIDYDLARQESRQNYILQALKAINSSSWSFFTSINIRIGNLR